MIIGECIKCNGILRKNIWGDETWFPSEECIGRLNHAIIACDDGIEEDEEEIEEE